LRTDLKRLQRDSESGGRAAARGLGQRASSAVIEMGFPPVSHRGGAGSDRGDRGRLFSAGRWLKPHPPAASAGLKERQLTHNTSENRLVGADLSPDGRYLAYSDPGGLHLLVIDTGETR
jgi:hypothetical protein